MMRLLADESIPARLVESLRDGGANVDWIKTSAPGLDDGEVWLRAIAETRILLTLDKDFGEISRASRMSADCGVILLRVPLPPLQQLDALAKIILGRSDWTGRFSVIEPGKIRARPL